MSYSVEVAVTTAIVDSYYEVDTEINQVATVLQ